MEVVDAEDPEDLREIVAKPIKKAAQANKTASMPSIMGGNPAPHRRSTPRSWPTSTAQSLRVLPGQLPYKSITGFSQGSGL